MNDEERTRQLGVNFKASDYETVKNAAYDERMGMNEFCRTAINKYLQENDHETIAVDLRDY